MKTIKKIDIYALPEATTRFLFKNCCFRWAASYLMKLDPGRLW